MACSFDHSVLEFCICFVLRYSYLEFFLPKKSKIATRGFIYRKTIEDTKVFLCVLYRILFYMVKLPSNPARIVFFSITSVGRLAKPSSFFSSSGRSA